MWTNAWVGLPYQRLGRGPAYDCLGLYLAINAARLGRILPDPACDPAGALRRGEVEAQREHYREVTEAREGDALLFRSAGRPLHVGYALDDRDMLHISGDTIASTIERWRSTRWRCRLVGVFRPHA